MNSKANATITLTWMGFSKYKLYFTPWSKIRYH